MCLNFKLSKYSKYYVVIITMFVSFFFSGCSLSVPEPDENNQTLLIIPVETIQTLKKFIYTVNFTIEDSGRKKIFHRIEPDPDSFFSYKSQLKPGKYKLSKLNLVARPGFRLGKKKKLGIRNFETVEFKLENGKATIIDKKLIIQQPERITGNDWKNLNRGERAHEIKIIKKKVKERNKKLKKEGFRHVKMLELDNNFKEKFMAKLKEVENFEKWEIFEQKANNSSEVFEVNDTEESEDY